MSGVEYTGGNSGWCAVSVCLNSTVCSASPRTPIGMSFAKLSISKINEPTILLNHWPGSCEWSRPRLRGCQRVTPRFDSVQRAPQHASRVLGRVQSCVRRLWIHFNPLLQLVAPHPRMVYIGGGVQREVSAGLVVGSVHFAQPALFFGRHARHLRFVSIERSQRFLGRTLGGDIVKVPDQLANFGDRSMPIQTPARSHALGEVEPQSCMRHLIFTPVYALLIAHVGQHGAPQFSFIQ